MCTGSEALRGVGVLALGSHQFPSHSPPAAADTRNLEFWEAPGIAGTLGWGVISRLLVLVTDLFSNHPLLSISAGAMLGLQPAGREPSPLYLCQTLLWFLVPNNIQLRSTEKFRNQPQPTEQPRAMLNHGLSGCENPNTQTALDTSLTAQIAAVTTEAPWRNTHVLLIKSSSRWQFCVSNFGDAFPALTHQKMGLVMTSKLLNSRKQQTMLVPSKTLPFPTATSQVRGWTDQKRYRNSPGRVLCSAGTGALL